MQVLILAKIPVVVKNIKLVPANNSILKVSNLIECITSLKAELEDTAQATLSLEDDEDLLEQQSTLKKTLYDLDLRAKRPLYAHKASPSMPQVSTGVNLPETDVPTFDWNVQNWNKFWEQFEVSIHSKTRLTNVEKLAHLKYTLKGEPASNLSAYISSEMCTSACIMTCL